MTQAQLEELGEHLDNIQTGIRVIQNELKQIDQKNLWDRPNSVDEHFELFINDVEERLEAVEDQIEELDEDDDGESN